MTERIARSRNETKNREQKYPLWAKATAAGALALGVVGGYSQLKHNSEPTAKVQDSYSLISSANIELQPGETVIDAAKNELAAGGVQLTTDQERELELSAIAATDRTDGTARVTPQPGEVITLDMGEFNGEVGADWRVRITPGAAMNDKPGDFTEIAKTLPSYYHDK